MNAFSDPVSGAAARESSTAEVCLRHEAGLHARPAVKLTKLAKKFASKVSMSTSEHGPWIDAKSIVKVMAAKTPRDSILHFRAEGPDAGEAVMALIALVEQDFPDDG
jgi:phosphocarrier protein HPr